MTSERDSIHQHDHQGQSCACHGILPQLVHLQHLHHLRRLNRSEQHNKNENASSQQQPRDDNGESSKDSEPNIVKHEHEQVAKDCASQEMEIDRHNVSSRDNIGGKKTERVGVRGRAVQGPRWSSAYQLEYSIHIPPRLLLQELRYIFPELIQKQKQKTPEKGTTRTNKIGKGTAKENSIENQNEKQKQKKKKKKKKKKKGMNRQRW
jgi:hypothetical protein